MKKLLIALLMLSTQAKAEFLYMPNEAGGEIVLTNNVCTFKGKTVKELKHLFSRMSSGEVLNGCWYYDEPYVKTLYENMGERVYLLKDFTYVK